MIITKIMLLEIKHIIKKNSLAYILYMYTITIYKYITIYNVNNYIIQYTYCFLLLYSYSLCIFL